jgi:hypothetical protein
MAMQAYSALAETLTVHSAIVEDGCPHRAILSHHDETITVSMISPQQSRPQMPPPASQLRPPLMLSSGSWAANGFRIGFFPESG